MLSQDLGCWIDAAFQASGWGEALDQTAEELGVRCLGLVWDDGASPTTSVSVQAPVWFADACHQILRDRSAARAGERLLDGGWTLTWRRPNGEAPYYAVLFALAKRPLDRAIFEAVAAVVRSAVMARARVTEMESTSALKAAALDQSPWGAAIIDADLRIAEMNESCAAMLRRADGISLSGSRILCRRQEDQVALSRAVAATLRVPPSNIGAIVRVARSTGAQPYVMRPLGPRASVAAARCLLMIVDPDEEAHSAQEIWRAMFDLTECELLIAEGLVAGRKISDIALRRGVSVETVRSQTKRLFERLSVTSQTQAAVLLSRVAPFRPAAAPAAEAKRTSVLAPRRLAPVG
jgi:DNA-binding NarL/FixJ family response regulator